MTILEALTKFEDILDQILVGRGRVVSNLKAGVKIVQAVRQADLGPDTNAILDELVVIGQKLEQVAGSACNVPPGK